MERAALASKMHDVCHIIPAFVPEEADVKMVDYCDMSKEEITIRGIDCVRKQKKNNTRLHLNGVDICGQVFYWNAVGKCKQSDFERGINLVTKGLGFLDNKKKKN
jgi:hypothetical protein